MLRAPIITALRRQQGIFLCVIIGIFAVSATRADATTGWTTSDLNMRTGPGTGFAVQTVVPRCGQVTIISSQDGWHYIAARNRNGWVSGRFVARNDHHCRAAQPPTHIGTPAPTPPPHGQSQAYADGYQRGLAQGREDGFKDGYDGAYRRSFSLALTMPMAPAGQAYSFRVDPEFERGYQQGYPVGYNEGFQSGQRSGTQDGWTDGTQWIDDMRERMRACMQAGGVNCR